MRTRRVTASIAAAVMVAGGISLSAAPLASAVPAQVTAGDVAPRAKVPVTVTVANGSRKLIVTVDWNDGLDARPGRDRFTVRVMAGTRELAQRTRWDSRPDVETITVRLTAGAAKAFNRARKSGDAVVAVSQQSDTNTDTDRLFERNHVTVVRISNDASFFWRDAESRTRDCAHLSHAPGADLSDCDLAGADLSIAGLADQFLTGANLMGANLISANLSGADLTGANLSGANLSGCRSTSGAPTGCKGPRSADRGADLTNANLTNANLSGASLSGADLTGADLTGADLTGADLTGAKCGPGGPGQTRPGKCGPNGPR